MQTSSSNNHHRSQRISAMLAAAAAGGYDVTLYQDPDTGIRDLLADAMHLASHQNLSPAEEVNAALNHFLEEAILESQPCATAVDAASLEEWRDALWHCMEPGSHWTPHYRLDARQGWFYLRDEKSDGNPIPCCSIDNALAQVLAASCFDEAEILAHFDFAVAVRMIAFIRANKPADPCMPTAEEAAANA